MHSKMTSRITSKRKPPIDFANLFHDELQRALTNELLKNHGDFLIRKGSEGGRVLSANRHGNIIHFKFGEGAEVKMDGSKFDTIESMMTHYYESGTKLISDVELWTPIYKTPQLIDVSKITFDQELGRGNFGQVWKATLDSSEEVAIKILADTSSAKEREECLAEARLMSTLNHENVVKLKGLSYWKQAADVPKLLLVLEYCNLGSLDKLLEKDLVSNKGKMRSLVDVAKGIEYLHEKNIIHRDIACRNCLVKDSNQTFTVKVADFGLSRFATTTYSLRTKRRLPVFSTSPDTLKTREWTTKSDVWSYGILMHEIFNGGKNPYEAHFKSAPLKQIVIEMSEGFRLPIPKDMSTILAQLALRCMSGSPSERPEMSEVVVEVCRIVGRNPSTYDW